MPAFGFDKCAAVGGAARCWADGEHSVPDGDGRLKHSIPFVLCAMALLAPGLGCRTLDFRGQRTFCSVHEISLKEDTVRVVYGLPLPIDYDYAVAEKKQFPHAEQFAIAGCIRRSVRRARVRYCPECREARAEYLVHGTTSDRSRVR